MMIANLKTTNSPDSSDKTSPERRTGRYLRLSLRRFSHRGDSSNNNKAAKNEADYTRTYGTACAMEVEIYPWSRCHQAILRLAKGESVDTADRSKIPVSIRNLLNNDCRLSRLLLSELLAPSSIQEAFRQLASTYDRCALIRNISSLWTRLYTAILPDMHAVLYPFEEFAECNIRKSLLTSFRDGVVLEQKLCYGTLTKANDLDGYPTVSRMLLILEQNTRDTTAYYGKLSALCDRLLPDQFSAWAGVTCDTSMNTNSCDRNAPGEPGYSSTPHVRRGSLMTHRTGDHYESQAGRNYFDPNLVNEHHHKATRSPLGRVKQALMHEFGDGLIRRHSYTPAPN